MSNEYDYLFKFLLVGDAGTGKSQLLSRFAEDTYTDTYISTIGVDFKIRSITRDGWTVKLQLWDTAGQERFRTITSSYYRGANAILLVYDITNRDSFQNLNMWRDEIARYSQDNVKIMVVGNKRDLEEQRSISTTEAEEYCRSTGVSFLEVSCKNGVNVEQAFEMMVDDIMKNPPPPPSTPVQPPAPPPPSSPQSMEEAVTMFTGFLNDSVIHNPKNELSPEITQFNQKVANKPTEWKLDLKVGEFEETRSGLTVRYKTGAEASSVAYELGVDRGSLAIALALRADDTCDSFRLGELSSALKGILEPLNSTKSTFSIKIDNQFDGTKIFQLLFEVKDETLYDTFQQLLSLTEAAKLDVDLEFSQRPGRQSPSEFLFFRLKADTEWKRCIHAVGNKDIASMFGLTSPDQFILLSFLSTIRRVGFELEFDSLQEFWETVVLPTKQASPPEYVRKIGWHTLAELARDLCKRDLGEPINTIYKNFEGIAGLHSLQFVLGSEHVLDVRGNNLDIFTLLPTFSEYESLRNPQYPTTFETTKYEELG